jgi:hypothetical protein
VNDKTFDMSFDFLHKFINLFSHGAPGDLRRFNAIGLRLRLSEFGFG